MKVLKTAAIVVGAVALAATGVGLALGAGLTAGVGLLSSAVLGGALATGVAGTVLAGALAGAALYDIFSVANALIPKPSAGGSQTKWKPDPYAGYPYAMGRTLVAGNIILRRGHGANNVYQTFVTVLSLCTAQSIDTTFLNKTTVGFDGSGAAIGTYAGQIWQRTQLGACPEPAALASPVGNPAGWTAAHKLSGMAATLLTLKYDSKEKNGLTSEPAPGWIGHWVKVYDPRLDSTYPGGSGPCRAYQEETYVWSECPHLHALTWAMGRIQNGVRVAGIGGSRLADRAKITGVDIASFVEGANLNDARGWKIGGQVVTRPDTLWNSLKAMLQAGGAQPALVGGVITAINRAPRVSLATITRQDIVGKCTFAGTQPRRSRINSVIPQYRSEAHDWEMVSASAVSIADYVAMDGDERTQEISYPLVQDVHQAAQLATYDICDAREAGPGSVPLKPYWLNYKIGDCVTFAPEDGFAVKCLVTGRALDAQSCVTTYTLRGETDGKHALALGQTGQAPPIVSLVYSTDVAAPDAADWTLAAGTDALPTLILTGAVGNPSADAVILEYRAVNATEWVAAGAMVPDTTRAVITVPPGAEYEAAISYRVRGVTGARLVLAAVTSGILQAGAASSAGAVSDGTTSYDADQIATLEERIADLETKLKNGESAS